MFVSGWKWQSGIKMVPSLPLLSCDLPVSMKENLDRKKMISYFFLTRKQTKSHNFWIFLHLYLLSKNKCKMFQFRCFDASLFPILERRQFGKNTISHAQLKFNTHNILAYFNFLVAKKFKNVTQHCYKQKSQVCFIINEILRG